MNDEKNIHYMLTLQQVKKIDSLKWIRRWQTSNNKDLENKEKSRIKN